jgi:hypothetical protein
MRKVVRALLAMSLVVPLMAVAAGPAGAVTGTTCKTFAASGSYSPPLPKLGVSTVVTSKVKATAKLGGCSGGGVTSGVATTLYTYKGNCNTFVTNKGGVISGASSSIKWSNGQTSTTTVTSTALSKPGVQPAVILLTTKVTKGLFAGTTASGKVLGTSVKGACISTGLGTFKLTGTGPTVFK